MQLKREQPEDWWEVEALFDNAFAPGREALSSYRLREGVDPVFELCLVARDFDGVLSGAVRFWPVTVGKAPTLLLGPIAVHPTRQGEGIAALLMENSLALAVQNWDRVLLVGDAPFYARYGFEVLRNVQMPPPANPDRVLGRALTPDAWDSVTGRVEKKVL